MLFMDLDLSSGNHGFSAPKLVTAMMRGARRVTRLGLVDAGLTDASIEALAASDRFSELEFLTIAANPELTPACLRHLQAASSLTTFGLGSADTDYEARTTRLLEALVELAPPSLENLQVSAHAIPVKLRYALERRFAVRGLRDGGPES